MWSTIAETYIPDGAATFASTNTVDPNIPDIDKFPHWVEPKNSRVSNPEYFDASLVDQIKTSDATSTTTTRAIIWWRSTRRR